MKQAALEVQETSLDVKFVPDAADLEKCHQFGQEIARRVKAGLSPTPAKVSL